MENEKYIIYGAGKQGKTYYDFLRKKGLASYIIGFCDKQSDDINKILDKQVFNYSDAKKFNAGFIIAIGNEGVKRSIIEMLDADGCTYYAIDKFAKLADMSRVEFNREFCAEFHINNMDEYFESAELEDAMEIFWDSQSEFNKMFSRLDLENVIELACGRGRHVTQYIMRAGHITLVDILAKNIELCKERFKDYKNITYYQNNGYNLEDLQDGTYTALFSYDAMVHFEMMDVYEYLVDIYRILVPGGIALLHHSNNDENYKVSFNNTVHGRNFMNVNIFAYLAYRAGFEVLDQKIIDWERFRNLDGITLLQKPI